MRFVGRTNELEALEKQYSSGHFEFSVVYGRRRVGKTALIRKFIEGKDGAYYVGVENNAQLNLSNLSSAIYQATKSPQGLPSFASVTEAFTLLFEYSRDKRIVFLVDEYPYLASTIRSASSELQALIDRYKDKSQLFLILCGSSMSFMEHQVLGYKSPLYGRRTSQYLIQPFNYRETSAYIGGHDHVAHATYFGVTGGIPDYLSYIDPQLSIGENLTNLFFTPQGRLFEEPSNLLLQELREPRTYNAILTAIAGGASKNNEIATAVGLATGALAPYLNALMELRIVERLTPAGSPQTSRKVIYRIQDDMFRFWFTMLPRHMNQVHLGLGERVVQRIEKEALPRYMEAVWEKITLQHFEFEMTSGQITMLPEYYGYWWGTDPKLRQEVEIDWIAREGDHMLFTECKWQNQKVGAKVLEELRARSHLFPHQTASYRLYSRSGFSFKVEDPEVRLISLKDVWA